MGIDPWDNLTVKGSNAEDASPRALQVIWEALYIGKNRVKHYQLACCFAWDEQNETVDRSTDDVEQRYAST